MLGPHQGRAVAEGPAESLAVERLAAREPPAEIGLGQGAAADPDERRPARGDVRRAGLEGERLEPAITRADDGQVRIGRLDRRGQPEVPVDADQRVLGRLVAVRRRDTRTAGAGAGSRTGCPSRR